ncbi:S-adenosylmethionine transporter [Metarhizium acridum]|uniref:S-adenosylmethionine transporter n=1 Tax=Metarhizium acridum TaxID=92637 RepID=UPI001C6C591E|nr:S-adenosylmethionine transporter [Metarhizium acridum]
MSNPPPFQSALLAGALAGTTVDLSLFPLDTLKTRLQSSAGFFPRAASQEYTAG